MDHGPNDAEHYPTFIDAAVAGVQGLDVDDFIDRWHDGEDESHGPLHLFLGLTEEEYATMLTGPDGVDGIVRARQAAIDGPQDGPVKLRFGVPASHQISSFANAALTTLASGHAVSVALTPPTDFPVENPEVARLLAMSTFRRLVDTGWTVEIRMGPDDQA
jgi:hypothetical protein